MEPFTQNEKVDMLLVDGECKQNAVRSSNLYRERYPERRHPNRRYFAKLVQKFRQQPEVQERSIVNVDKEIDVLAYVNLNKTFSTRQIVEELHISHQSVWKILKKHKYRSFKYQLHQHLCESDNERRIEYCREYLQKMAINPDFPYKILYTDESRFTNNGMFNRQNNRYWAQENEHLIRDGSFQERFGFNVWMGIKGRTLVGPILFYGPLTGNRYLGFLQNEIEAEIESWPVAEISRFYFQQDGAPPHNARQVAIYLNQTFADKWIGTQGPIRWPARSPDLTPMDFFLWGYLKNKVYHTAPRDREDLEQRLRQAVSELTPHQLDRVVNATINRIQLCMRVNGGHFEQLL